MSKLDQIPIENIYYLLCYAWNTLEEMELAEKGTTEQTKLVDLFAKVLINGLIYLRKRGMDRGYVDYAESSSVIRGKINFNETIKQNLQIKAKAYCEYDRLNHNVLHNQLIKATIVRLVRDENLDKKLAHELGEIAFWFMDVDDIAPNPVNFSRVIINRNNSFYRFLLAICRLIIENLLVTEKGETQFREFHRDIRKMRTLFEAFVYNFYRLEQKKYTVSAKKIGWHGEYSSVKAMEYMPGMATDITLISEEQTIIIDTKFTRYAFVNSYRGEKNKLRSGHLYQIFSYVVNAQREWDVGSNKIKGILLYPEVDEKLDLKYVLCDHPIEIRTINLAQHWRGIHNDLLAIIGLNDENRFS